MNDEIGIIVTTCDRFKSVLNPGLHLLNKYWPGNKIEVVYENELPFFTNNNISNCRFWKVGTCQWSDQILYALKEFPDYKYFILITEDNCPYTPVDQTKVDEALQIIKSDPKIWKVQLNPVYHSGGPNGMVDNGLEIALPSEPYLMTTQVAIWHRDLIEKHFRPGENIWQVELEASKRFGADYDHFVVLTHERLWKDGFIIERGKLVLERLALIPEWWNLPGVGQVLKEFEYK